MLFTIEKSLTLSSMENARVLVCGADHRKNLTGVSVIENFADMGARTGYAAIVLNSNVSYLSDCIGRLKKNGFYGIITKDPSENMISICEEQDITLIAIPQSSNYFHITQQILDSVLKMYADRTALINKAYDEFYQPEEASAETTMDIIANMLDTRIIAYYESGRIGSAAGYEPTGLNVTELGEAPGGRHVVKVGSDIMRGFIMPFKVLGKTFGRLFIQVEEDRQLDQFENFAIKVLMLSVTLKSTKSMAVDELELRLRNDLISDLLTGGYSSERNAVLRARDIGWNIEKQFMAGTMRVEARMSKCINKAIKVNNALREGLIRIMNEELGEEGNWIVGATGDVVNVLWPYDAEKNYTTNASDIRRVFQRLFDENKEIYDLASYVAGVGGKTNGVETIRKSYNDAVNAMKFGALAGKVNTTYDMNGLGLYRFISRINSREEMESFIPQNLHRLIEYDQAAKNVLVNTLDVFLQCGCNITKAAEELGVHYKSLVYRINRIKEIMEIDNLEGDTRLEIELAFKILHIMENIQE